MGKNIEKYYAIILDGEVDAQCEEYWFSVDRVLNPELNEIRYPFIESLRESISDILSMEVGESVVFQPNLNDSKSVGILRRVE